MANVVLAYQRALWPAGQTPQGQPFFYDGNLTLRLLVVGAGKRRPAVDRAARLRSGAGQLRAGAVSDPSRDPCRRRFQEIQHRRDKSLKERLVNFRRSRRHAEEFWALRNVSFDVAEGSTVGLIGANGSGKSTMLKLVGGILSPTSGTVTRRGRIAALLELGAGFHGDLTGRENVYLNASILGMSRASTDRYFHDIVEFSGIE